DWGGSGTPMVFLHGAALTAHTWDLVSLALRSRVRCIAIDARGHGDTDWAADGDYSQDTQVRDVERLVVHLGLSRHIIMGMSMGGGTALAYAGRNAANMLGLVVIEAGPGPERPNTPATAAATGGNVRDFIAGPAELDSVEAFVDRAR